MPKIVSGQEGDSTVIEFSGNLNVKNSSQIKDLLLTLNPKTKKIIVIQQDTDNLDISFLQLLFSWMKKMKNEGKELEFEHHLNKEYSKIVEESGFINAIENLIKKENG